MQIICLALLILALLPVIIFALCRITAVIRLRRMCKNIGAKIHFRSPISIFDKRFGKQNSLYIQTEDRVYSIRLIGFFFRATHLRIYSQTQYSVKNYSFPVVGMVMLTSEPEMKTKPICDFRAFVPKTSAEIQPCYLLSPGYSKGTHITYGKNGPGRELCDGDKFDGSLFFTVRGFCDCLNK